MYGMAVTNNIRSDVLFDNIKWQEQIISNDEILEKLENEKKNPFLSFAYGVWITAYGRRNLLECLYKLDEYVVYR